MNFLIQHEKEAIMKKHELNSELATAYFHDSLKDANTLSSILLESIDFASGRFYTFLPTLTDNKNLHSFKCGMRNKSVRQFFYKMMFEALNKDLSLSCFFDDVLSGYENGCSDELFTMCGLHYENEVYYLLTHETSTLDLVERCFKASDAIWHTAIVLTRADFTREQRRALRKEEISEICHSAEWILVGAYDGEGYLLWEK